MRGASSGAHVLAADGGAIALGSVANFGWVGPQATNSRPVPPSRMQCGPIFTNAGPWIELLLARTCL